MVTGLFRFCMSAVVLTAAESIKVEFEPSDPGLIQHRLERVTSNLAAIHPDAYYRINKQSINQAFTNSAFVVLGASVLDDRCRFTEAFRCTGRKPSARAVLLATLIAHGR